MLSHSKRGKSSFRIVSVIILAALFMMCASCSCTDGEQHVNILPTLLPSSVPSPAPTETVPAETAAPSLSPAPTLVPTASPIPTPTADPNGADVLLNAVSVSANNYHSLAVDAQGIVWEWGYISTISDAENCSAYGSNHPLAKAGLPFITKAVAGRSFVLALDANGNVWGWGENVSHIISSGSAVSALSEVPVQLGDLHNIVELAVGSDVCYALDSQGDVWRWDIAAFASPSRVEGLSGIVAICADPSYSLALDIDGNVWMWGIGYSVDDYWPTLSTPTTEQDTPSIVEGLSDIVSIECGDGCCAAIDASGSVWIWGSYTCQFADNYDAPDEPVLWAVTEYRSPEAVPQLEGALSVSIGSGVCAAIMDDGSAYCWYLYRPFDEYDAGITMNDLHRHMFKVSDISQGKTVSCGHGFCLVNNSDGTIQAWGGESYGQLGSYEGEFCDMPIEVDGLPHIVQTASCFNTVCIALADNGDVWQFGNGPIEVPLVINAGFNAKKISKLSNIISIDGGEYMYAAVSQKGDVWGFNGSSAFRIKGLPGIMEARFFNGDNLLCVDMSGNMFCVTSLYGESGYEVSALTDAPQNIICVYDGLLLDGGGRLWLFDDSMNFIQIKDFENIVLIEGGNGCFVAIDASYGCICILYDGGSYRIRNVTGIDIASVTRLDGSPVLIDVSGALWQWDNNSGSMKRLTIKGTSNINIASLGGSTAQVTLVVDRDGTVYNVGASYNTVIYYNNLFTNNPVYVVVVPGD